eukprot:CAMPEP_0197590716 /NCGR_PEP_ID=MMETSP1326-20131121/12102_1 /TAXON_ID=1155430 /ORGANISM="Genus nov. species nov., Strain RCC2288" /LENGTH=59 /DNA_ID=CAMNT_0043155957 /DNA_START=40 /DNA_END=215 /DNA_ORIENTATION=+
MWLMGCGMVSLMAGGVAVSASASASATAAAAAAAAAPSAALTKFCCFPLALFKLSTILA